MKNTENKSQQPQIHSPQQQKKYRRLLLAAGYVCIAIGVAISWQGIDEILHTITADQPVIFFISQFSVLNLSVRILVTGSIACACFLQAHEYKTQYEKMEQLWR